MLLSLSDVSIARGGVPLLDAVSFDLAAGQLLLLKGPNGIGKTTLLRTIAGLQPAQCGQIACDPDDMIYTGHLDGVKPTLTVVENLDFWAQVYGGDLTGEKLAQFQLQDLATRLGGTLSAGQKRRLGLARLAVAGRKLWLLDEPTVSLDAHMVKLFAGVLKNHLKTGGFALIATHIDLGVKAAKDIDLSRFQAKTQEAYF